MGQDSLRMLSEETGGFAVVNTNDIAGAFRRLVEENSSYYILGYYPANDRRDGRFRRIDVRVGKPGLTVRARRGYVAPRGRAQDAKLAGPNDATPELREAMSSPVPVSGLALAATASVFKGPTTRGRSWCRRPSAGAICRSSRRTARSTTISKSRGRPRMRKGSCFPAIATPSI